MSAYSTELSDDRRTLRIHYCDGRCVTLRSELPGGFTNEQALRAGREFLVANSLSAGQVNRSRLVRIFGYAVLLKLNTGPPTWWYPRIEIRSDRAMIGWMRGLVALSWRKI